MSKYNVGDKFIIEISKNDTNDLDTTEYYITNGSRVYEKEELDRLQKCETELSWDEAYIKGLRDAWELAKKLWLPTSYGGKSDEEIMKIFGCDYYAISKLFTPQEALAKLKAYEKENEIKVGDVVAWTDFADDTFNGVVLDFKDNTDNEVVVFNENGCVDVWEIAECKKTGKHIDITSVLEQLRGE